MANAPRVTYGQGIARHHGSHRKVRWGTPELEEKEGGLLRHFQEVLQRLRRTAL
ncbi:MAG: hypothetical protein F6J90_28775 [Moorea sp. SIOASIH]|nr:hypothetical protein [Moorena sp. SIOASIH]